MPANIACICACRKLLPVPQVAAFDTSFHQTMPDYAYRYALPEKFYTEWRMRRFGFHGTSHKFVSGEAIKYLGNPNAKIITCHLGNGSSMAAVKGGKCVDTSMGYTPLAGVPMGTRSGDIDPALLEAICNKTGMNISEAVNICLNKKIEPGYDYWNDIRLIHEALPEVDLDSIDTSCDVLGSELESRIDSTLRNVYCAAFAYIECILAGAVICGVRAARHRVPAGREVIIVLGCWFRPDGTLPPLLRGRADRAVEYWRETLEKTGHEPWIVASGGQGMDEPVPEAEAIRNYLVSRGIPENRILTETKSASTYQNLLFSRRIMAENGLPLRCVFATTNYHVFRSGMWAARAGLAAEGISSRTKWWFWPNAFMRECIGLIASRWKQELVLLIGLAAFFALMSMTLF